MTKITISQEGANPISITLHERSNESNEQEIDPIIENTADFSGNNFSEVKQYFKNVKNNPDAGIYEWCVGIDKSTGKLKSYYHATIQEYLLDMGLPFDADKLKKDFIIVMFCGDGNCVLAHKSNKVYCFDHENRSCWFGKLSKYKSFKDFATAYDKYNSGKDPDLVYSSKIEYDDISKSVITEK